MPPSLTIVRTNTEAARLSEHFTNENMNESQEKSSVLKFTLDMSSKWRIDVVQ